MEAALEAFQTGLVVALRELSLAPPRGSALASRLGLNRQLSWQVATLAAAQDPAAGLAVLPGTKGLALVIDALEAQGAEPSTVAQLRGGHDALEVAIREHAGDRATLAMLASACHSNAASPPVEHLRREGTRAQSALLGASVRTQLRGVVLAPSRSGSPDHVSMSTFQAFDGLVRFRQARSVRLFYEEAATHDDGSLSMSPKDFEVHVRDKFQLVASMSSGGGEELSFELDGQRAWVGLRPGPLGTSAATTWAFAGVPRYEPPRYRSARDTLNQVGILSYVPTELLLLDFYMERSIAEETDLSTIGAMCFDGSTGYPRRPATERDPAFLFALPGSEPRTKAQILGDVEYAAAPELIARSAATVGVGLEDLVGVRFAVKYLMSPACLVLTRHLPVRADVS